MFTRFIALLFPLLCFAQKFPDKIVVTTDVYGVTYNGQEFKYDSFTLNFTNKKNSYYLGDYKIEASSKEIEAFIVATQKVMDFNTHFKNLGIDTLLIQNKPEKLLTKGNFEWIPQQKDFILPLLGDIENYKAVYEEEFFTGLDFSVGLDDRTKKQFTIEFFDGDTLTYSATTTPSRTGYNLPWLDKITGLENYNPALEKLLATFLGKEIFTAQGKDLTKSLSEKIIASNWQKLYELAAFKHESEINKLKSDFEIEKAQLNSRQKDQYIIELHHADMPPNMHIKLYADESKNRLYSTDSIKAEYKDIVSRVKNITFITDYLASDPDTHLYIKYYNNTGISDYDAERMNKNPKLWKIHDRYAAKQAELLRDNPQSSEYILFNINYSEKKNCGCNLRLDEQTLKNTVTLEVASNDGQGYSLWFLLPDNRVVLYLMDGFKTLGFKYNAWGSKFPGIQAPCQIFSPGGEPEGYNNNDYTSGMYQMLSNLFERAVTLTEGNNYTEKQREAKWVGNPGAEEEDIKDAEKRLGITLPDDYKKFLMISNGYGTCLSIAEPSFFPARQIEYLNKIDPQLVSKWNEHVDDEVYKAKFASSIIVGGGFFEPNIFLLVPPMGIGGTWEYWKFSALKPGETRYGSMAAYFVSVINFINTVNP